MTFSSPPLTHKKHKTLNVSHPSAAQVFCNNSTGSPRMSLALECDLPKLEAANGGSWTRNGLPDTTNSAKLSSNHALSVTTLKQWVHSFCQSSGVWSYSAADSDANSLLGHLTPLALDLLYAIWGCRGFVAVSVPGRRTGVWLLESSIFTDSFVGSVSGVFNSLVWLLLMQVWSIFLQMVSICSLVVGVFEWQGQWLVLPSVLELSAAISLWVACKLLR